MSKLYRTTLFFYLTRSYAMFMFRRFYGDFIVVGKENIPLNSPVIFAPNHINALMDALAVHYISPRNQALIFLARADMFKNKMAAKFLRFTKIMPAFRMRDGIENLGNNADVFNQCIEILHNNQAIGIMPEGNQEIERKLRPLVKGIFRIAFAAQQKYGDKSGVKIVPVGIDYGDLIKAQKHIVINIGKPIEVADYIKLYADNPAKATNEIKDRLRDDLCNLTLNLATDNHYECFETVVETLEQSTLEKLKLTKNTLNEFIARQYIANRLVDIEKNQPEKMIQIDSLSLILSRNLKQLKIKSWFLCQKDPDLLKLTLESILILISFPFFLVGLILNLAPFFSPVLIRKYIFKAQYIGFFSSLHFGLSLITFPLFYLAQTLLFLIFVSNIWWAVLLFLLAQYPIGKLALSCYSKAIKFKAKIHFLKIKKHRSTELTNAQEIYARIENLVFLD